MTWMRALARGADDLLFPPACLVCDRPCVVPAGGEAFCGSCRRGLFADPNESCPRCAATVGPHVDTTDGCPSCRGESFAFDSAIRLGPYDGERKSAVLAMQHRRGEALADALGRAWAAHAAERFSAIRADAIVPVPLHWRRSFERGYNQAEAIARGLAGALRVPCRPRLLRRVRSSPIQPGRSATERRENVKGAFTPSPWAAAKDLRIILVDDVMTTGATAHVAARALRVMGAAQVIVACVARR